MDKYPPKDPSLSVRGPPPTPLPGTSLHPKSAAQDLPAPTPSLPASGNLPAAGPATSSSPPGGGAGAAPKPLLSLEKPFDVDEFAQLLGETSIRVTVPREDLAEVLRRVCDFMGFGIYVYSIQVRPARSELLKEFVVELTRVDYSVAKGDWVPFQELGRSDSPFGPSGQR